MLNKLQEAQEHLKRAEIAMKKNIFAFKFSPDLMTAASEYSEAAQAFFQAGSPEESKAAWLRAGEIRLKQNDQFSAGRCFESAGAFDKASESYGLAGKTDAAARALMKSAETDPARSAEAFEKVIAIYDNDDKAILAVDIFRQYLNKIGTEDLVRYAAISERFTEVLKKVGQWAYVHKEILTQIIVALVFGDTVKASKILDSSMSVQDWMRSSEYGLAEDLVTSIKERDEEALATTLKKQQITFLRPEVVRLARTLKVSRTSQAAEDQPQVDEDDHLR